MVGITAFGGYVPRLRLARKAIVAAHVWADPGLKGKARGERSMCNWDEDAVTMGVEAARNCLASTAIVCPTRSCSPAPAPLLQIVRMPASSAPHCRSGEDLASVDVRLVATRRRHRADSGYSRAFRAACIEMRSSLPPTSAERKRRAPANSHLATARRRVTIGNDAPLLEFVAAHSATVDFVDHFRAAGEEFDYTWEERWIRDEGLAKIVPPVIAKVLQKAGIKRVDGLALRHAEHDRAGGRRHRQGCRALPPDAVRDNLDAVCGETGAAHPLVMLLHAVETAVKPGDTILLVGFGQGCDAVVLRATSALASFKSAGGIVAALANRQEETNYQKYLAFNDLITLEKGMRAERDDYKTAMTVTYRKRDMLLGLVGGRCTQCGTLQFPRTDICVNPQCKAMHTQEPHSFRDERASGIDVVGRLSDLHGRSTVALRHDHVRQRRTLHDRLHRRQRRRSRRRHCRCG